MVLTLFLWVIVIWHGIGLLGSIDMIRGGRTDGWQIGGTVFHTIIVLWGGCVLWLIS